MDLSIFNPAGRKVCTLEHGYRNSGLHTLDYNGLDGNGVKLPSGVYFLRLAADGFAERKRFMIAR
ncbi:T9SS type A sorting domain-containing protein [candidate division WOR-3 bacterium]|nr:T9SS type A sorting domain-containing protein [candidate division WOR-3 bacterium]